MMRFCFVVVVVAQLLLLLSLAANHDGAHAFSPSSFLWKSSKDVGSSSSSSSSTRLLYKRGSAKVLISPEPPVLTTTTTTTTTTTRDYLDSLATAVVAVTNNEEEQQKQQKQQQQQQQQQEEWEDSLLQEREDFIAFVEPVVKKQNMLSQGENSIYTDNNKEREEEPMLLWPSLYGTFGVVFILIKAIRRVLPIALEPLLMMRSSSAAAAASGGFFAGILKTNFFLHQNAVPKSPPPLTNLQAGIYVITCLFFAYAEGYRGFQKKFAPLVVKRSFTLVPSAAAITTTSTAANGSSRSRSSPRWHLVLAPLYSMGLFHATAKRAMVSRCVTLGVAALVFMVKGLPYPYRNIVDAGVVVGLTWGSLSLVALYVKAWIQKAHPSGVSAELPPTTAAAAAAAAPSLP